MSGQRQAQGVLVAIGGGEDRDGAREILWLVARLAAKRGGRLAIVPTATRHPVHLGVRYRRIFDDMGLAEVEVMQVRERRDAFDSDVVRRVGAAGAVFFTGGDQSRIMRAIDGTPLLRVLHSMYRSGAVIAGTSAGAVALSDVMLTGGPSNASYSAAMVEVGPGLGFLRGTVIDSHFAQRGRIGRLMGVVAHHPGHLGLGIDEDTAAVIEADQTTTIVGSGAAYIVDGAEMVNELPAEVAQSRPDAIMSMYNLSVHVLGAGARYDLGRREPVSQGADAAV